MRVSRATIESAEENFRVARNRYGQGVGKNTVELDAETLRTQALSNYYSSVYSAVAGAPKTRANVSSRIV